MVQKMTTRSIEDGTIRNADIASNADISLDKILYPSIAFEQTFERQSYTTTASAPFSTSLALITPLFVRGVLSATGVSVHTANMSEIGGSIANPELEVAVYNAEGQMVIKRSATGEDVSAGVKRLVIPLTVLKPGQYYIGIFSADSNLGYHKGRALDAAGQIPRHGSIAAGLAGSRLPSTLDFAAITPLAEAPAWMMIS